MSSPEVELVSDVRLLIPGEGDASEKTLPLKMVSTGDTVFQVKTRIEKEYGYKAEAQQLSFHGDIMDDEEPLTHYTFKPNTFNYAVITLRMLENPPPRPNKAEKEDENKSKLSLLQKMKALTINRDKKNDIFIPQKMDERLWIPVGGFIAIKPPVRRAMGAGTKGVLRFMDEYKGHAGVLQECCFALVSLAALSEEGLIFKKRLLIEGVVPRVAAAIARFKSHFGIQKQGLGVFQFLLCDHDEECVSAFVTRKGHKLALAASELAYAELLKLDAQERKDAVGMTCADIIEVSAFLLHISCSQDSTAHRETKTSNAEKIFESAKDSVNGCLQGDSVLKEIERLHEVLKTRPPHAPSKKSKK
jgi:hypothetical protein